MHSIKINFIIIKDWIYMQFKIKNMQANLMRSKKTKTQEIDVKHAE